MGDIWQYSMAVFIIVLISASILNLLKNHFVFQLAGIAFFLTFIIIKINSVFQYNTDIQAKEVYIMSVPALTGISACLISMVIGFWLFPPIRKKFRD